MGSVVEMPMYVNCVCNDCCHRWKQEILTKGCQTTMIRGL
jgi:hypothetical protein